MPVKTMLAVLVCGFAAFGFATPSEAAGVAGFHPDCQVCHTEKTPTADNANLDACMGCHGEKPEKGFTS